MMANQSIRERYEQLRSYFEKGQDDQIKLMLSQDLDESDHDGTLLHLAVRQQMSPYTGAIDASLHLEAWEQLEQISTAIVKALLMANARIDIPDPAGQTALQLLFESLSESVLVCPEKFIERFVKRLERDCRNDEELVETLANAGCTLYQAVLLQNLKLIRGLLRRGRHIDEKDRSTQRTALHAAVRLNDLNLVKWLLDNNADVNVCDDDRLGPLYEAADGGHIELVHLLLEHGADPNAAANFRNTPLHITFRRAMVSFDGIEKDDHCIELLLQHGAKIPQLTLNRPDSLFEYALALEMSHKSNGMKYLICQLALLDRLGTSISSSIVGCSEEKYRQRFTEAEKYYELCQQILCRGEYEGLSLFELLTASDEKMKIYARNRTLTNKIEDICADLSVSYLYYAKTLRKRFAKAADTIELENAAIPILCKLFNTDYNQCPSFGRGVVGYLSKRDLKRLCQVFDASVPLVDTLECLKHLSTGD